MPMEKRGSEWLLGGAKKPDAQAIMLCFPHGGGSARDYQPLVDAAPPDLDVLAIQLPGRGPRIRETPISNVETLLAELMPVLHRAIDRPYILFGHSVGAALAMEVAQRLEATVSECPLLVCVSAFGRPAAVEERGLGAGAQARRDGAADFDWAHASDEAFLAELARFGQIDDQTIADPELRQIIVRPTRADFALNDTLPPLRQLTSDVLAVGGADDDQVPKHQLAYWADATSGSFELQLFPGGHFYFSDAASSLIDLIVTRARVNLAARPPSMAFGRPAYLREDDHLYARFQRAAQAYPDRTAIVHGGSSLAFSDLLARVQRQSAILSHYNTGPGQLTGICLPTGVDFVVAMLAVLRLGGAFFQIPTNHPPGAMKALIEAIAPNAIVTFHALSDRFEADLDLGIDVLTIEELFAGNRHADRPIPPATRRCDDLAFGVLSSGTTGAPKAILVTHQAALLAYDWRSRELPASADEREAANVFFIWEVLRPLLEGRSVHLIDDETIRDADQLSGWLKAHAITRVLFTPSLLRQLLTLPPDKLAADLTALRKVLLNGEVVGTDLSKRARLLLPGVELINDYSISECHDVATTDRQRSPDQSGLHLGPTMASGAAMDGIRIYILDGAGELQPYGVPGDIYVSGPTLSPGYLNAPDETQMRFLPDPFQPSGATMFKTGDVGRLLPGGSLQVFGRTDFMVKLRGYSIVPSAIEAALRTCTQVTDCAVVVVEDEAIGQPDHLVACVVAAQETAAEPSDVHALDVATLRLQLKNRLPIEAVPARFKAVPFIPIDPGTGKRDVQRLLAIVSEDEADGLKADDRPDAEVATATAVQTPNEHHSLADYDYEIADCWTTVLGARPTLPGENFFDAGGHSLKAGEFAALLRQRLSIHVPVADIYAFPTYGELSRHLSEQPTSVPFLSSPASRRVAASGLGDRDIAIVGMSCRFPGASGPDELWEACKHAREAFRVEPADGERLGQARGPCLSNVDVFDPAFWGISHREAVLLDPQHRLFLEAAWQALEHAGHTPAGLDHNISVYAGCYLPTYLIHHLGAADHLDPADPARFHLTETTNEKDYLAQRVAHLMDLHGAAVTVQSSCSTGLVAVCQAADALRAGHCNAAIAGAVSLTFPQGAMAATEGHVISPTGKVRPFDACADGTLLGDGVGAVVLRRRRDAEADGDTIYAILKGYAVNNDGRRKAGFSAPSVAGQTEVIRSALQDADADPLTIEYVEAHGTGTRIGDPLEVMALRDIYGATGTATDGDGAPEPTHRPCALGSVKPNIGHANIAAGMAGLIKTVQALRFGEIPPVANFEKENPELQLAGTRLMIPTSCALWPEDTDVPVAGGGAAGGAGIDGVDGRGTGDNRRTISRQRRAAVSCFGIGGTNAHAVLEAVEPATSSSSPEAMLPVVDGASEVLNVSAKTRPALLAAIRALANALEKPNAPDLRDVAHTLRVGRHVFAERVQVLASSHSEAVIELRDTANDLEAGGLTTPVETLPTLDGFQSEPEGPKLRRVALPTYPFQQIRCWPEDDARGPLVVSTEAGTRGAGDVPRTAVRSAADVPMLVEDERFYTPSVMPIPRAPVLPIQAHTGPCLILAPPANTIEGENPAAWLQDLQQDPRVLTLRADSAAPMEAVTADAETGHADDAALTAAAERCADRIVLDHLDKQTNPGPFAIVIPSPDSLVGQSLTGLSLPRDLETAASRFAFGLSVFARVLKQRCGHWQPRIWLLSDGETTEAGVLHDLICGTAVVINQELSGLEVRCLTHDRDAAALSRIILATVPLSQPIVDLRDGRLSARVMQPYPLTQHHAAAGRARFKPGSVHVITGGLGRIGLALAEHLVAHNCKVVLTTRRTIDQVDQHIRTRLQASDGAIRIVTLDPTSPDDVVRCFESLVARGETLGMVFHCAGLADLAQLDSLTTQCLRAEFEPKITATNVLQSGLARLEVQRGVGPSHVVLFSSLAAELGGVAMAGYAAANRYLDGFAERQMTAPSVGGPRWISIAWDDWAFDYDKEQTAAYGRTRAHLAMPPDLAIEALHRVLGTDDVSRVSVASTDLAPRWQAWRMLRPAAAKGSRARRPVTGGEAPAVNDDKAYNTSDGEGQMVTPSAQREEAGQPVIGAIIEAYSIALGTTDITPQSNYYDLGGDSLLAIDVVEALDVSLPQGLRPGLADVLEAPSPAELCQRILDRAQAGAQPSIRHAQRLESRTKA
ncbi:MAG: alpha/beta fold hydrolase [Pseudomonadota bacterium]